MGTSYSTIYSLAVEQYGFQTKPKQFRFTLEVTLQIQGNRFLHREPPLFETIRPLNG
jgi:hypothetical protein